MATVTLTPKAYWQLEGWVVTAKNPEYKQITVRNAKRIIVEFEIPKTAAYAYSIVSNNRIKSMTTKPKSSEALYNPKFYDAKISQITNITNVYLGLDVTNMQERLLLYGGDVSFNVNGVYESDNLRLNATVRGLTTNKLYLLLSTYQGNGSFDLKNMTIELTYTATASNFKVTKSPNSGFLNPIKDNKFTFDVTPNDALLMQYEIISGTLYYKLNAATSYTSKTFTGKTYTLPANTLSAGNTYNIYATLKAPDNTTANTSTTNYNTNDATPTVTVLSPSNETIKGSATFKWSYRVSTGMPQYAYEIQISTDGSSWTTLKSKTISSATSVTISISTIGTNYWRVRAYNQSNVTSAWTPAAMFINVLPPTKPTIISITGNGRPEIMWTANNQMAFQVRVSQGSKRLYDSGEVYSSNTTYKVMEYLEDGTYLFAVRIINEYGTSAWTYQHYLIDNGLVAPEYSVSSTDNGVNITIAENNNYEKYYLKRNGILIGKFSNREFTDKFSIGKNQYQIICVTGNDAAISISFEYTYFAPYTMLLNTAGNIITINKRWNDEVVPQTQAEIENDSLLFLGENKPQINTTKMKIRRFTVAVNDNNFEFDGLLGNTLFLKTPHGIGGWVVLLATNRTDKWFGNETVCDLSETRYLGEVINYDL